MKIENEILLDFKDVLIRPKRSTLASRSDVSIEREFTFLHTGHTWSGVPIVAANMDTVGTFEMYGALKDHKMLTALHKHHSEADLVKHFMADIDPNIALNEIMWARGADRTLPEPEVKAETYLQTNASQFSFYSMGISQGDYDKFKRVMDRMGRDTNLDLFDDRCGVGQYLKENPLKMVCVDVANGYTENFAGFISRLRREYPNLVIMAGNVVTAEMTEQLILAGADIVKVGIGPGSVCTTRKMTGVGYPQLSAIIECVDAAHGLGGLVCADGGCTVPGDIAKAFCAGADFVMLGGMLAGHDQSGGDYVAKRFITNEIDSTGQPIIETKEYKRFYGMSSDTAMNIHNGGVASYRASEGKTVEVEYRGDVNKTIQDILGGLRSMMTYVGARKLKHVSLCTTFVRVTQQLNEVFGKSK